jgi:hypothetical protein
MLEATTAKMIVLWNKNHISVGRAIGGGRSENSEPVVALSRALAGKAWDSKPPISPGKSQTVPAVGCRSGLLWMCC